VLTGNSSYLQISNAAWSGPLAACKTGTGLTLPYIYIPSFPSCNFFASASMMPGGALVFSNGDAAMAARSASTGRDSNMYHNKPEYSSTAFSDPDLESLGAASGTIYDYIALSFDLTPTLSGPVTFRCVLNQPVACQACSVPTQGCKHAAPAAGQHSKQLCAVAADLPLSAVASGVQCADTRLQAYGTVSSRPAQQPALTCRACCLLLPACSYIYGSEHFSGVSWGSLTGEFCAARRLSAVPCSPTLNLSTGGGFLQLLAPVISWQVDLSWTHLDSLFGVGLEVRRQTHARSAAKTYKQRKFRLEHDAEGHVLLL
jgi:hypothetical protein